MEDIKIYRKLFKEMAYDRREYKLKVIHPPLKNAFNHFVKLKLTNEEFAESILPNLYNFTLSYQEYWIKDVKTIVKTLCNKLATKSLDKGSGTKEAVYIEQVEDDFSDTLQSIIINALDEYPAMSKLKKAVSNFCYKNGADIEDYEWGTQVKAFFYSISPKKNLVKSYAEVEPKLDKFIKDFLK